MSAVVDVEARSPFVVGDELGDVRAARGPDGLMDRDQESFWLCRVAALKREREEVRRRDRVAFRKLWRRVERAADRVKRWGSGHGQGRRVVELQAVASGQDSRGCSQRVRRPEVRRAAQNSSPRWSQPAHRV